MLTTFDPGYERIGVTDASPDVVGEPSAKADILRESTDEQTERRVHKRFKTAFRAGCMMINRRACMGMFKNMSTAGVMVQLDHAFKEGDVVHYFWDERRIARACVAWSRGNLHRPTLVNLSLGDAQIEGLRVRVGALVTLRFSGVELTNACVRWSQSARPGSSARTGLAFARRMSATQLSAILDARGVEMAA